MNDDDFDDDYNYKLDYAQRMSRIHNEPGIFSPRFNHRAPRFHGNSQRLNQNFGSDSLRYKKQNKKRKKSPLRFNVRIDPIRQIETQYEYFPYDKTNPNHYTPNIKLKYDLKYQKSPKRHYQSPYRRRIHSTKSKSIQVRPYNIETLDDFYEYDPQEMRREDEFLYFKIFQLKSRYYEMWYQKWAKSNISKFRQDFKRFKEIKDEPYYKRTPEDKVKNEIFKRKARYKNDGSSALNSNLRGKYVSTSEQNSDIDSYATSSSIMEYVSDFFKKNDESQVPKLKFAQQSSLEPLDLSMPPIYDSENESDGPPMFIRTKLPFYKVNEPNEHDSEDPPLYFDDTSENDRFVKCINVNDDKPAVLLSSHKENVILQCDDHSIHIIEVSTENINIPENIPEQANSGIPNDLENAKSNVQSDSSLNNRNENSKEDMTQAIDGSNSNTNIDTQNQSNSVKSNNLDSEKIHMQSTSMKTDEINPEMENSNRQISEEKSNENINLDNSEQLNDDKKSSISDNSSALIKQNNNIESDPSQTKSGPHSNNEIILNLSQISINSMKSEDHSFQNNSKDKINNVNQQQSSNEIKEDIHSNSENMEQSVKYESQNHSVKGGLIQSNNSDKKDNDNEISSTEKSMNSFDFDHSENNSMESNPSSLFQNNGIKSDDESDGKISQNSSNSKKSNITVDLDSSKKGASDISDANDNMHIDISNDKKSSDFLDHENFDNANNSGIMNQKSDSLLESSSLNQTKDSNFFENDLNLSDLSSTQVGKQKPLDTNSFSQISKHSNTKLNYENQVSLNLNEDQSDTFKFLDDFTDSSKQNQSQKANLASNSKNYSESTDVFDIICDDLNINNKDLIDNMTFNHKKLNSRNSSEKSIDDKTKNGLNNSSSSNRKTNNKSSAKTTKNYKSQFNMDQSIHNLLNEDEFLNSNSSRSKKGSTIESNEDNQNKSRSKNSTTNLTHSIVSETSSSFKSESSDYFLSSQSEDNISSVEDNSSDDSKAYYNEKSSNNYYYKEPKSENQRNKKQAEREFSHEEFKKINEKDHIISDHNEDRLTLYYDQESQSESKKSISSEKDSDGVLTKKDKSLIDDLINKSKTSPLEGLGFLSSESDNYLANLDYDLNKSIKDSNMKKINEKFSDTGSPNKRKKKRSSMKSKIEADSDHFPLSSTQKGTTSKLEGIGFLSDDDDHAFNFEDSDNRLFELGHRIIHDTSDPIFISNFERKKYEDQKKIKPLNKAQTHELFGDFLESDSNSIDEHSNSSLLMNLSDDGDYYANDRKQEILKIPIKQPKIKHSSSEDDVVLIHIFDPENDK